MGDEGWGFEDGGWDMGASLPASHEARRVGMSIPLPTVIGVGGSWALIGLVALGDC